MKRGQRHSSGAVLTNASQVGYWEKFLFQESGQTLDQVAQRGGECPIFGEIQGQAKRGSEQANLSVDVPVHCRGVGLDGL